LTPLVSNMKPTNKAQDDDAVFALSTEVKDGVRCGFCKRRRD
jgi:hypothetical protein